jgi:lysophospholipase L1-like esterase
MTRLLTDHEHKINSGAWIACSSGNTTDNGDSTYTIHSGLSVDIPIGGLQVRVKSIGGNPPSSSLTNSIAFHPALVPKNIQLIFIGDSITAGQGTTTNGDSAHGPLFGANSYPVKTVSKLTGVTVTPFYRGFPGGMQSQYITDDLDTTISIFDKHNYTDIYCILFYGANDLVIEVPSDFQTELSTICSALKTAGAKVIIVPVLSRKDSIAAGVSYGNIARRNTFNTWLSANYSTIADGIVDFSGHPEIFADDAPDDATYFAAPDSDGLYKIHPTDAGADIIATQVASAVTILSATASLPISDTDDAANFITASGITDSTIITAVNAYVTDLKNAKLWNRFAAIYLFVGGTSDTHKFNLKDPRDLDAAFRLTYSGTPQHDTNGVTWVSGSYADTKYFQPYYNQIFIGSNYSLHYYSRTATPSSDGIDMGSSSAWLTINLGGSGFNRINSNAGPVSVSYIETGLFCSSRYSQDSQNYSLYKNGVLVYTSAGSNLEMATTPLYIGGANHGDGTRDYPSSRNCGYCAIGYGLTAAEEAAHYTVVQAFQTALGRAV